MSDFVKVNLMSGYSFVAHKNTISLNEGSCSRFYVEHLNGQLAILSELLTKDGFGCKEDYLQEIKLFNQITREEYDRLCKELGVDNPGMEKRIKDLQFSNKCLRHERDEAQRKYFEEQGKVFELLKKHKNLGGGLSNE